MKKIALVLFSSIVLTSCGKDVQTNYAAMQGKIDNVLWKSTNTIASRTSAGGLSIKGSSAFGELTLNTNSINAGVYSLGTSDNSTLATFLALKNDPGSQNYQTSVIIGSPSSVSVENAGTGYTDSSFSTISSGVGIGLIVEVTVDSLGAITNATIVDAGYDYTAGEMVTIDGGDGNATLIIEDISVSNGEIEITDYDGTTVSGNFKFTAINEVDQTLTCKDGIFYKVPIN
jgi:hypothetical protein